LRILRRVQAELANNVAVTIASLIRDRYTQHALLVVHDFHGDRKRLDEEPSFRSLFQPCGDLIFTETTVFV
jgi:hypothetical protein